ncbi:expressed protein [Echinococcus multilocularis]|uniref:Expressed protein n=1 Tax=Echinococcus multilocularis TaxID=6211 RepID=A0A068YDQ4_ECHMU|nr:expressed protein [Echinococcus multilocularis]
MTRESFQPLHLRDDLIAVYILLVETIRNVLYCRELTRTRTLTRVRTQSVACANGMQRGGERRKEPQKCDFVCQGATITAVPVVQKCAYVRSQMLISQQ